MNYDWNILGEAGFQFFGKMSASISHEIKNALAIMNENAGLFEDYASIAEKGISIDLQRLKSLAGNIRNQVQRADEIVRNMNRFAHSVDRAENAIEVGELLALMTSLAHRFATMRGVTLELKQPQKPVTITTNQFFLEHLIWLCLEFATDKAGEEKIVGLTVVRPEEGISKLGPIGLIPTFRKKGLGRKLMELSLHGAAQSGFTKMHIEYDITNQPAHQLYSSLGFQQIARQVYYALKL